VDEDLTELRGAGWKRLLAAAGATWNGPVARWTTRSG